MLQEERTVTFEELSIRTEPHRRFSVGLFEGRAVIGYDPDCDDVVCGKIEVVGWTTDGEKGLFEIDPHGFSFARLLFEALEKAILENNPDECSYILADVGRYEKPELGYGHLQHERL